MCVLFLKKRLLYTLLYHQGFLIKLFRNNKPTAIIHKKLLLFLAIIAGRQLMQLILAFLVKMKLLFGLSEFTQNFCLVIQAHLSIYKQQTFMLDPKLILFSKPGQSAKAHDIGQVVSASVFSSIFSFQRLLMDVFVCRQYLYYMKLMFRFGWSPMYRFGCVTVIGVQSRTKAKLSLRVRFTFTIIFFLFSLGFLP